MALAIGFHQQALHSFSKGTLNSLKRPEQVVTYPPANTKAQEAVIPSPALFEGLSDSAHSHDDDAASLPTVAECAVHLELLQCFHTLRAEVLKSTDLDKAFGILPKPEIIVRRYGRRSRTIKKKDQTFATRRKEKWPLFIDLAVSRFIAWFRWADSLLANPADENIQNLILPPLGMSERDRLI
jgi:hypothetical protein